MDEPIDFRSLISEEEIPSQLKTYVSEEYFAYCINCDKYLLGNGTHYMIEKAINNGVVEFEHAICMDCSEEMRGYMSEESMRKVNAYFMENFDEMGRMKKLYKEHISASYEKWTGSCAISGKSMSEMKEYQLYAHCIGKKLIYTALPFVISGEITEHIAGLLSAKTKEELDNFADRHFNLPPEWSEIFKTKKIPIF